MASSYNGLLYINDMNKPQFTCNSTDKSQDHTVEQNKTETKQVLLKSIFLSSKNRLNKTRMHSNE